jgi:hypothetical protein
LAQKASSADKLQILSLETKKCELKGKLGDLELEQTYYDSLKLELEQANEDLNSKNHEIECMEKGIEATHKITSQEIDTLRKERLNSMEENSRL